MGDFVWAWGSFIQPREQRNCFVKRPEDEREDPRGHGSSSTPDTAGLDEKAQHPLSSPHLDLG